jgi:hypothetical protein
MMPSEFCVKPRLEEQKSVPVRLKVYLKTLSLRQECWADLGYINVRTDLKHVSPSTRDERILC